MSVGAQSPALVFTGAVFVGSVVVAACGVLAGVSTAVEVKHAECMTRWGINGALVSFVVAWLLFSQ